MGIDHIIYGCPKCRAQVLVDAGNVTETVTCGSCGHLFTLSETERKYEEVFASVVQHFGLKF